MFFVTMIAFIAMIFTLEQQLSFEKVNNLNKQKKIVDSLTKLQKDDIEIALIQFNGKSTQLHQEIDKLRNLYKYDYIDQFLFNHDKEYLADLDKLSNLTTLFNERAHNYYVEDKNDKLRAEAKEDLESAFQEINQHINNMLLRNITYNQEKFYVMKMTTIVSFIVIFLLTLWYRKRLYYIYKDIEFLYQIEKNKMNYDIYTLEADAIAMRMNRKSVVTDNPSMTDPVTGINNHKGMLNAYSSKKNLKDSNFTSVTLIEIDNFSKTKRAFTQELTQTILKKVAYTISLHEQAVDVIARTDYNQFTLILSRTSKEQSFKDVDLIRQSISELKFNVAGKGAVTITVSGGFVIKPNNTNLEEALRQAKEILQFAKTTGTNRILQQRDLAERHM